MSLSFWTSIIYRNFIPVKHNGKITELTIVYENDIIEEHHLLNMYNQNFFLKNILKKDIKIKEILINIERENKNPFLIKYKLSNDDYENMNAIYLSNIILSMVEPLLDIDISSLIK